jgi:hypothetical protein
MPHLSSRNEESKVLLAFPAPRLPACLADIA